MRNCSVILKGEIQDGVSEAPLFFVTIVYGAIEIALEGVIFPATMLGESFKSLKEFLKGSLKIEATHGLTLWLEGSDSGF